MSAKIINSHRYKTITKLQLDKKRKKNEKLLNKENSKKRNKFSKYSNSSLVSNVRLRKHREKKMEKEFMLYSRPQETVLKEPKQKIYIPKSFIITCTSVLIILLMYIAAKIMRLDEKIVLSAFHNKETDIPVNLVNNYELNIGLIGLQNNNVLTSNNLIINELNKRASISLINIDKDYSFVYDVASSIEKINELEYLIIINEKSKITCDDIRKSILKLISLGESNIYYERLINIKTIEETGKKNEVRIVLNEADSYFVYSLDFPITSDNDKVAQYFRANIQDESISYVRDSSESTLSKITLKNYGKIDSVVEEFVDNKIDMFFATSNNEMQLIGKKEYNTKKYRDGETLFLLGNSSSNIFSKKEIRQSLMYSMNREEIIKNSDNNFIELIDLPFIYSTVKYKYDTIGADNILTSSGWYKNRNNIYELNDGTLAKMTLLVNENDIDKVRVANEIKEMAIIQGISIEIASLSKIEIERRVMAGDYDLVLADIYINEIPNIEFLQKYLDINSSTSQAFLQIKESSITELPNNIRNLQYVLSNEVACIGIYARNINLVYQKYITGFENINYMSIFDNLKNIGKVLE